jgi:hypothetical protein
MYFLLNSAGQVITHGTFKTLEGAVGTAEGMLLSIPETAVGATLRVIDPGRMLMATITKASDTSAPAVWTPRGKVEIATAEAEAAEAADAPAALPEDEN